jgi:hypothetical protein
MLLASSLLHGTVAAHSPDPSLSGTGWRSGQRIPYAWAAGQVPPGWLQSAFTSAANQSNWTLFTRNPSFKLEATAVSRVAYGEPTGCSPAGIACFSRSAPTSFRVWYRAHGSWFDWGRLRWCQAPGGSANGCFDAENIGLDELGHVQGLGHHLNRASASDYLDAVVQAVSRSKPTAGWDAHRFGRCDVARLQLLYDRVGSADPFSTCLSINSTITLGASATSVPKYSRVTFTAALRTAVSSSYGALSGDPVSGRKVLLQRRLPGGSTWTTVSSMAATLSAGSYSITVTISTTYEWRAVFQEPDGEGLHGSASPVREVTREGCAICPPGVLEP